MTTIRPSDIVKFIDKVWPDAEKIQKEGGRFQIMPQYAGRLNDLLNMLNEIPETILQLNNDDKIGLRAAKSEIESMLKEWQRGAVRALEITTGYSKENPVKLIRRLLEKSLF